MKLNLLISAILFSLIFSSCGEKEKKTYTLGVHVEIGNGYDTAALAYVREHGKIDFEFIPMKFGDRIEEKVSNGELDFGIVPNHIHIYPEDSMVRTVTPLKPDVFLIMLKPEVDKDQSIQDLMHKHKLGIFDPSESDSIFWHALFKYFSIQEDSLDLKPLPADPDSADVSEIEVFMGFVSASNYHIPQLLEKGAHIYPLDELEAYKMGSSVEGFCNFFPKVTPMIIPKGAFINYPKEPILTFSVVDLLITNKSENNELVRYLYAYIIENMNLLAQVDSEFGNLKMDANSHTLSFPLHEGTIQYLTRNRPTFLERYAELIGLFVSIMVLAYGGLISLRTRIRANRKDRVDEYYKKLLELRIEANAEKGNREEYMDRIDQIRAEAFEALISERLPANTAFEIFLKLLEDVKQEIETSEYMK